MKRHLLHRLRSILCFLTAAHLLCPAADTAGTASRAGSYVFTTIAGHPGERAVTNGHSRAARLQFPGTITLDPAGNAYVVDSVLRGLYYVPSVVRRISTTGEVTTIPAEFPRGLNGLTTDADGHLYVISGHAVYHVDAHGRARIVAGDPDTPGRIDGLGTEARFSTPMDLAFDAGGRLFVADYRNDAIRLVTPDGRVSTFADLTALRRPDFKFEPWEWNGVLHYEFHGPQQIAFNPTGDLYINDRYEDAGGYGPFYTGLWKFARQSREDRWDAGVLVTPYFEGRISMAVDRAGNLFLADPDKETIERITPSGERGLVAGAPRPFQPGQDSYQGQLRDGTHIEARFNRPSSIAVDRAGNLYLTDAGSSTVRKGILLPPHEPDARIANVSVRSKIARHEGLVVTFGARGEAGPLLIRAVGPGLVPLLPDVEPSRAPWIDVGSGRTGWVFDGNATAYPELIAAHARTGAFPLAAGDTAVVLDAARSTTVQAATLESSYGTVLLEWYDLAASRENRLTSVTFRRVDAGEGLLVGFVITGTESKALLLHAQTESASRYFDIAYEANAVRLTLHDSQGRRLAHSTDSSAGYMPLLSRLNVMMPGELGETVLVHSLPPGAYTLHASRLITLPGEISLSLFELR